MDATTRVSIVRCDGCGAAVRYLAEKTAPVCAFCGSKMHTEMSEDPLEQAQEVLPFRVSPEAAQEALSRFLRRKGFFRPADLASEAVLHSLKPIWWPAWIFDADAEITWAADSNAGSGRSAWAPHAGRCTMTLGNVVVSASRGLTAKETFELAPHFDLRTATPAAAEPVDTVHEQFDTQRSAARRLILNAVQAAAEERVRNGQIPGSRFRNVQVSVLLRGLITRRVSLPSYVLAYRYRGALYRSVVHGQDATVVFGKRPLAVLKVALVVMAALAALVVIAAMFAARV